MADLPREPWIRLYVQEGHPPPSLVPSPAARRWYWANAYHCTPMMVAGQLGWSLLSPFAFSVVWDGTMSAKALRFSRHAHGHERLLIQSHFGGGVLSLTPPFNLRTSPDVDILVKSPPNLAKDGVCVLEGLVETDWFDGGFAINLRFTRPGEVVRWEEGEPLCQLVPYPRGWLERFTTETIVDGPEHAAFYDACRPWYEDRRARHETRRPGGRRPYDGQYRRGQRHDGVSAPESHRARLTVQPFPGLNPAPREF